MRTAALKLTLAACLGACVTATAPIVWPKPHPKAHHIHHVSTHQTHVFKQPTCPPSDFVSPALRPLDGPESMIWAPGSPDWPVGVTRPHPAPEPGTLFLMGAGLLAFVIAGLGWKKLDPLVKVYIVCLGMWGVSFIIWLAL